MQINRTTSLSLMKIVGIILVIAIIVGYAVWRSLNYTRGPVIVIESPSDGASFSSSTIDIKGQALRINNLLMNGTPLSITEEGKFDEKIIIFKGINTVEFSGHDQFGRTTTNKIHLVGL